MVFTILLRALCDASNFSTIPSDITPIIFDCLSTTEKVITSRTNKQIYSDFNKTYHHELRSLYDLQIAIGSHRYEHIRDIVNNLYLSELFSLQLPCILRAAYNHSFNSTDVLKSYLKALNMHVMSISEYNQMDHASFALRLLVLSSRALIHYYIPDEAATLNAPLVFADVPFIQNGEFAVSYAEYPWIIKVDSFHRS